MLSGFKKINDIDIKFRTTSVWNSSNPMNPIIISLTLTTPTEFGYLKYYILFLGTASANYFWFKIYVKIHLCRSTNQHWNWKYCSGYLIPYSIWEVLLHRHEILADQLYGIFQGDLSNRILLLIFTFKMVWCCDPESCNKIQYGWNFNNRDMLYNG